MIRNISIENLYPHPQNPRKDLGDLTELAQSIKAQGVLQNLTVVPWNFVEQDKGKWDDDYYRFFVLIGHRRLAASKLAGLTDLPCAV
ncbi:MAG: ParB N-terminal domain-containing protein, partial [Clostridia bacterium]